ncbi:MAG: Z1 domain-containing protein [Colwellia sp.]|uniref:Z1 domain-containing protein n=1 Tax=Colwellia sp. TaxID=56799 RepID=UPI0025C73C04|nr:Z1 domain-containing protein [Colwellia sp.]NQZ28179.1 Z1 domain-containing protein [Colwellia sp.]
MNRSFFNKLIAQASSKLKMMEELGVPITPSYIDVKVNEIISEFRSVPSFECTKEDLKLLKFNLESMFNIKVGEGAIKLPNPDLPLWFHNKKSKIDWSHWEAYKDMLLSQARSIDVINENEKVIDSILDYSGDPTTPGTWSRKGLVMGNVQSGKTQNFLGLINKAIDCGYKTIIVLGGHLNDLRKQTQERVDEGVLGRESKHLILKNKAVAEPIGVGIFNTNKIHTGTSTMKDFNKASAESFGIKLNGSDPVIFTIKKHTSVLEGLYKYIKDEHMLSPDTGKRLDGPLLLIDDEADYASINTKHQKEEVTKTNDCIRNILSLFNRNTYIGYTATPFANIFIDPDVNTYNDKDDLFPKDFMIKIPVPDNYMGQDFFFGDGNPLELDENEDKKSTYSPAVIINDYLPVFELKKNQDVPFLPESLKEAVRSFILIVAIRSIRGESTAHNTMLVNISHLKDHQNQLEFLIEEYRSEIEEAIKVYSKYGFVVCRDNQRIFDLECTFNKVFNVAESYSQVFSCIEDALGKIKTWAINQSNKKSDNRELDYSQHKENGLSAIVIGGHKLSRGLTLEGLSISYFARNSKAYDTLMQMCRWFGYRPTYKDLCRVYLPQDSLDWYSFISSSIRELYQELDLMARRGDRPSEFGLKVREHPGAMIITAKNKIGAGTSEIIKQDLWGQIQRRFKFKESNEINSKNLVYAETFVNKLIDSGKRDELLSKNECGEPIIFSEVGYNDIIDFINDIVLPEDDIGTRAVISHLKSMRSKGLKAPKVCLFNQKDSRNPRWTDLLESEDKTFINEKYVFAGQKMTLPKRGMNFKDGNYYIPSVQLGNPDDERFFLKSPQLVVDSMKKKPVNFDYLCSEERDFPALIIYLFAVAHVTPFPYKKENDSKIQLAHGHNPTLGFTLSFPRIDKLKGLSSKEIIELNKSTKHEYKVNKIQSKLREIADYDDYDDE